MSAPKDQATRIFIPSVFVSHTDGMALRRELPEIVINGTGRGAWPTQALYGPQLTPFPREGSQPFD